MQRLAYIGLLASFRLTKICCRVRFFVTVSISLLVENMFAMMAELVEKAAAMEKITCPAIAEDFA